MSCACTFTSMPQTFTARVLSLNHDSRIQPSKNKSAYTLGGFTVSSLSVQSAFSTFPLGTCLLSILWIYLALDRIYDLSLRCILKQHDSPGKKSRTHAHVHAARRDSNPLWFMPTPLGASKHSKKPHLGTRCARAC